MTKKKPKKIECQITYNHDEDDSNFDILSKLNGWADFEDSNLIDDMPHLGAVIEYWQLVVETYDVSLAQEMIESIYEGTSPFEPYNEFVDKYKLSDKGWGKFKSIDAMDAEGNTKSTIVMY